MSKSEWGDCPICKKEITSWPSISRVDNKTDICSDCGLTESLESWLGKGNPEIEGLAKELKKEWKQPKQEGNNNE